MKLDALLQLADEQAITASDEYTTNTIDLGSVATPRQIGDGEPLAIVFSVDVAIAATGGSFTDTCDFMAVQSANANLSSHTVMAERRVPASELVAGALVVVPIPPGRATARYVGGRVELGTGDSITISAWLLPMSFIDKLQHYPNGYTVL